MPTRIKLLLAAHFLALPAATLAARGIDGPYFALISLAALVFADAGVLGLWGATGKSRWWFRFIGVTFGLLCAAYAIPVAQDRWADRGSVVFFGSVVALPTLAVLLVLRVTRVKFGLELVNTPQRTTSPKKLQFTISHLLIATATVAVTLAIQQGISSYYLPIRITPAVASCATICDLGTFWAALGTHRPLRRLMIVVAGSFLLGATVPFLGSAAVEKPPIWSAIIGCQSLITAATLLVFRSCGWRLCRSADASEDAENLSETSASAL